MPKQLVYHGSDTIIKIPQILKSQTTKDFGTGFYCTVIKEQAERWAKRNEKAIVNVYSLLINTKLNILEFKEMNDEWLDFIVSCRSGKSHNYDIAIGAMANDQIYNFVSDFIDGVITREQFWVMAKFKYPTHQIAFCKEQALKCLHFEKSYEAKK